MILYNNIYCNYIKRLNHKTETLDIEMYKVLVIKVCEC